MSSPASPPVPGNPAVPGSIPGGTAPLAGHPVARIGYGAMQLQRLRADPQAAVGLIRRAVECGVTHVDTAQFYGNGFVNEMLRSALPEDGAAPKDSKGVVVATKVGGTANPAGPLPLRPAQRPDELRAEVEENLRCLGRDRLDLVYLRRLDAGPGLRAEGEQDVPLDDQLATMTALRDEGKIGAIGISGTRLDILRAALPAGIAAVQNAYSLVSRDDEDMLRLCQAENIAWVPFFPLGGTVPQHPKVTANPVVRRIATEVGATPAQIGLAWPGCCSTRRAPCWSPAPVPPPTWPRTSPRAKSASLPKRSKRSTASPEPRQATESLRSPTRRARQNLRVDGLGRVCATLKNMSEVGIRALKQNASAVVAEAAAGEVVTITDRGRAVAQLTAIPTSRLRQLVASGKARPPRQSIKALPVPEPGPNLSADLAAMRGSERY